MKPEHNKTDKAAILALVFGGFLIIGGGGALSLCSDIEDEHTRYFYLMLILAGYIVGFAIFKKILNHE